MRWGVENRVVWDEQSDHWWPFYAHLPHRCEVCWGWFWLETGLRKRAIVPLLPIEWRYRHFMGACERAQLNTLDDRLTADRLACRLNR